MASCMGEKNEKKEEKVFLEGSKLLVWYGRESQIYLENPHEESHRGSHQDSLLVLGQSLKASDVGRWSVLRD